MISKNAESKGPKRRDEAALQVLADIIIPAGTLLRQESGKAGTFKCGAEYGEFTIVMKPGESPPPGFKRVVG